MKKNNKKIFVVTHKKYKFPKDILYEPIEVNANRLDDLGYIKDNTKDNISDKNPNYCELTALYWIWKNYKCDIVGINHYRRYLSIENKKKIKKAKTIDDKFSLILTDDQIDEILKDYDVIVPTTKLITKNVYTKYDQQHHIKDLDNCRKIISKKYKKYLLSFDKVMKQKEYAICNMCVMKKENFDNYCEWLFDILFELEKVTDISNYSQLQKRIYGFLSERLFNVWLDYNKLNIKKVNIVATEHDSLKILARKAFKRIIHKKS